jgi:hypothetical protein
VNRSNQPMRSTQRVGTRVLPSTKRLGEFVSTDPVVFTKGGLADLTVNKNDTDLMQNAIA